VTARTFFRLLVVVALSVCGAAAYHVSAGVLDEVELEAPAWTAVAASGDVEARLGLRRAAPWHRVFRGDRLMPATRVRTRASGRVTLTHRESLVIVNPSASIRLTDLETAEMGSSVGQTSGSVTYKVDGLRRRDRFEVVTPYLVVSVKGSAFEVTVGRDFTAVSVERGAVELDNRAGGFLELEAGDAAIQIDDGSDLRLVEIDVDDVRAEIMALAEPDEGREILDRVATRVPQDDDLGSAAAGGTRNDDE